MMNYEIFKDVVEEKFMDYMPDEFKNAKLAIAPVQKVNVTLDGLSILDTGRNISPTIYINDMYERYKENGDLENTIISACNFMAKTISETAPVFDVDNFLNSAKDKIVFQLINTEQNKSFLEKVPHREFQDLSIIYKVVINVEKESIHNVQVTNELSKRLGMDEEMLFKSAAENTRRILPPTVRNMKDVITEMFEAQGMPEELSNMMMGQIPEELPMWVITNNVGNNGAVSMLYENELHELAENMESDLYILPSSVHEVIAVSTDMGNPEELAQMVAEINMQEVSLSERLSNQVYHYDKDLRKLSLATDTPNQRLDGIVSEPPLVYEAQEKAREEAAMELELTMEELITLINDQTGDFIIRVEFGEEDDNDAEEKQLQT